MAWNLHNDFKLIGMRAKNSVSILSCILWFFLYSTAVDGEVMEEFYNENGRHKDTKYYYGKTSESKLIE